MHSMAVNGHGVEREVGKLSGGSFFIGESFFRRVAHRGLASRSRRANLNPEVSP